jgi:hypothetical protein
MRELKGEGFPSADHEPGSEVRALEGFELDQLSDGERLISGQRPSTGSSNEAAARMLRERILLEIFQSRSFSVL